MSTPRLFDRVNGKPAQITVQEMNEATRLSIETERAVAMVNGCIVNEHEAYQAYLVTREQTRLATDKLKIANDALNYFLSQRAQRTKGAVHESEKSD